MDWAKPEYSKTQVDKAGRVLIDPTADIMDQIKAETIVDNWRSSHNYPLNTFKVTLRRKAQEIDPERLVAQRIKRMSSIEAKLLRFKTMQMSQMQDLGGCRAILGTVDHVNRLVKKYEDSELKHNLNDIDDYISSPKNSGYRGIHLIYKYVSDKSAPSIYNGLSIEMQIRSKLQHAWATAVETVGTFLKQSLKSSQGEEDWLRFFALMGSALARREGSLALIPDTPKTKKELVSELRSLSSKLNVPVALKMYGKVVDVVGEKTQGRRRFQYYLLRLEPKEGKMTIVGFERKNLDVAAESYLKVEREIESSSGSEAVLVSVDSMANLRRAFPNYFLDTQAFLEEVKFALK